MGNTVKKNKIRKDSVTKDQQLKRMIGDRRGMKGIGDGSRAPSYSVGTYSKGTLYIPQSLIDSVNKPTPKKQKRETQPKPKPKKKGNGNKGKKGKRR